MTATSFGTGIEPVEMPAVESEITPTPMPEVEMPPENAPVEIPAIDMSAFEMPKMNLPEGVDLMEIVDAIKAGLRHEMEAAVADIERRLQMAREIERANATGIPRQTIHTEDLNLTKHLVDGYTVTANSPALGSIAWASLAVVYMGIDYNIANGNTDKRYTWFVKPATYNTATRPAVTLLSDDVLPALGPGDALIFVNNGGIPVSALETSISYAVGPGVVGSAQLANDVQTVLSTLQSNDIAQQSALDGAISTYYQNDPPWPAGAPSPGGGNVNMGDVWYDANDNGAFRWTGATPGAGITANTWQRIADTDNSALEGKVNTKTTTYLAATTSPPVAPAGGFSTGDLWMKTNQNNLLARWSGSAWVDLQLGDAAISGVGGAKVGAGVSPAVLTGAGTAPVAAIPTLDITTKVSGTLPGSRVGAGVPPTVLTGAGTAPVAAIPNLDIATKTTGNLTGSRVGAGVSPSVLTGSGTAPINAIPTLSPAKLNTAFHMLY